MAQTNYESAKDSGVVYIQTQTANKYQTPVELPLAAYAMEVTEIEYEIDSPQTRRKGQNGTMSKGGSIPGMRSGTWRMVFEIAPSGAVATEMDPHILFLTGIFDDQPRTPTATTVSGAGSTAIVVDVASAAGITAGDVVGFTDTNGNVWGRRVTVVDEVATPDNITIEPPLHFVPAASSAVTASKTYSLSDTAEDTAFTLWKMFTHGHVRLAGCVANSYKWTHGNDPDAPTLEVSGWFREYAQGRPGTLSDAMDNSQLTMPVTGTEWKGITKGAILLIEAEGANTDEVVYVTADPTTYTLAVERNKDAAGASAHASGATFISYEPTPSLLSYPVSPKAVYVYVSQEDSVVAVESISEAGTIEVTGGVSPRERGHGDTWKVHGYIKSSDLACKTNFSAWAEKATWDDWYRHDTGDQRPMAIQYNTVAGKSMVVILSRQVLALPKLNPSSDDHVPAVLESEDRGSRTALPSVVVATL